MDPTTFSAILEALDSRREVEERRREERYTALIERVGMGMTAAATGPVMDRHQTLFPDRDPSDHRFRRASRPLYHGGDGPNHFFSDPGGFGQPEGGRGTEKGGAIHGCH
ncbi:UNVERIFIED_CONTAM: hypothetical protein FKN15_001074 [Acipenser sinensis]